MNIKPIEEVDVVFNRNLPTNDYETSQMINNLTDLVDRKNLISQLRFIKDASDILEAKDREDEKLNQNELPNINEEYDHKEEVEDLLISYEQKFYDETARKVYLIGLKNNKNLKLEKLLSKYGAKSSQEFFAECFANMVSGKSNDLGNAMKEFLEGEL